MSQFPGCCNQIWVEVGRCCYSRSERYSLELINREQSKKAETRRKVDSLFEGGNNVVEKPVWKRAVKLMK